MFCDFDSFKKQKRRERGKLGGEENRTLASVVVRHAIRRSIEIFVDSRFLN
jgi:hypothetical protein